MKKVIFLFILFLFEFSIYSLDITLKEKVFVIDKNLYLKDIVFEKLPSNLENIIIYNKYNFKNRIKNNELLKLLISQNVNNINLSGKETFIEIVEDGDVTEDRVEENEKETPIAFLEEYLSNYVDKERFKIKITLIKTEPQIDLNNFDSVYNWEINKLNYGLKDIANLKRIPLIVGDKKYFVNIDVNIFADVWISKQSFLKDDFLKKDEFYTKNLDITAYKEIDNLVFEIIKAENTKFIAGIGTGEILRWNVLKKIPSIIKDENLKLIIKRKNIEVTIPCVSLSDAYENEKIKVKLINGKEKIGILRKNNGELYVEI